MTKQAIKITPAFVRDINPPEHGQLVFIETMERGLALMLVVSYGGTKTFRALTYVNGKPKTRKLGTYPAMSVPKARKQAREHWENPEEFEERSEKGTFKEVAQEWIKRHVDENKLRSKPEIERSAEEIRVPKMGKHAIPRHPQGPGQCPTGRHR